MNCYMAFDTGYVSTAQDSQLVDLLEPPNPPGNDAPIYYLSTPPYKALLKYTKASDFFTNPNSADCGDFT